MSRRTLALAGVLIAVAAGAGAVAVYAAVVPIPPTYSVPPSAVPVGTLAGKTATNVLSVSAFTRAINQDQGTNVVLTRNHFDNGQSTGWHTHPGPNIVVVVSGELQLTDEHCNVTTYGPGQALQGFATGLDVHQAVAVGPTEFYSLYFLPKDATVLRTDANPPGCAARAASAATTSSPGNAGSAPGHNAATTTSTPGKSGSAPGHNK
jgi:quercetin dioxygenase-like cupin family protein